MCENQNVDILTRVKKTIGITTNAFDDDVLYDLIESAKQDLGISGVVLPIELDAICRQAITTYCKMNFGEPSDYDRLKKSYDEQKAQLQMSTGYTVWTVGDVE